MKHDDECERTGYLDTCKCAQRAYVKDPLDWAPYPKGPETIPSIQEQWARYYTPPSRS